MLGPSAVRADRRAVGGSTTMTARSAMPGRRAALAVGLAVALGGSGAACVDLFHTTEFTTLCDRDADACRGAVDAAADVAIEAAPPPAADPLCRPSEEARARAARACAWLSACLVGSDGSALARCMTRALAAFDCRYNPTLRPRGVERSLWSCLGDVSTCDAVGRCLHADGPATCLLNTPERCSEPLPTTFIECTPAGELIAETACVLDGRACAGAGCAGKAGRSCAGSPRCEGDAVIRCEGDLDVGRDCSTIGAGRCAAGGGNAGCEPIEDAGTCREESTACSGDVASACIGGRVVTLDCAAIGRRCQRNFPADDPAAACTSPLDGCASDCTTPDLLRSCDDRGSFEISCASAGLGACVKTARGPRCSAPK